MYVTYVQKLWVNELSSLCHQDLLYVSYLRLHCVVCSPADSTIIWIISIVIAMGLKGCGDAKSSSSIECYTQ